MVLSLLTKAHNLMAKTIVHAMSNLAVMVIIGLTIKGYISVPVAMLPTIAISVSYTHLTLPTKRIV